MSQPQSQPNASVHTSSSAVNKYNISVRLFHWLGALLLIATVIAIKSGDVYVALHKSLGASFLLWTLLRIANRFISPTPAPIVMPKWQTAIAHMTHVGLYIAMLAMPVTGVLMSMYSGRGVSIFGIINIAGFDNPDRDMAGFFNGIHTGVVFYALVFLMVAHIIAAVYHQWVVKDRLINRML